MSSPVSLLIVAFLIFMNAFFVAAEFSLVRVRKSRLHMSVAEGKPGAKSALKVAENVNDYLSACQLGITIASLALGWIGEPAVSKLIYPITEFLGMSERAASVTSVAVGFIVITILHIVAGELIPKSLAIVSTEKFARLTAFTLIGFYYMTYVVMWLFNSITRVSMKIMGYEMKDEDEAFTSDEIMLLMDQSTESGLIDPEQNRSIDNLFELDSREVSSIMTPRNLMKCIDLEKSSEENMEVVRQSKFTRYPVCRGGKDSIEGFLHIKDILFKCRNNEINSIPIRPITAVLENAPVSRLMKIMRENESKIAVVVDEYGGTVGIVTVSDIMERVLGRMDDEYIKSSKNQVIAFNDNTARVHGYMSVDNLEDLLDFAADEDDEFNTVAGLLFTLFEKVPEEGDKTSMERNGYRFEFTVIRMNRNVIQEVEIQRTRL